MKLSQPNTFTPTQKAECFIQVFGEAPRNEWRVGKSWTLYPLSTTDFGGDVVKPFYNKQKLADQRDQRSRKQWYIEALVQNMNWELCWFALGRQTTLDELNTEKLWLSLPELESLRKSIWMNLPKFDTTKVFYNADLWVLDKLRWKGVWSRLYEERMSQVVANWIGSILVRTTKKTDKPYRRYKDLWYKEVYEYNDEQQRVILTLTLTAND